MTDLVRAALRPLLLTLLLSSCATPPAPPPAAPTSLARTAELAFEQGLRRYEGGHYALAVLWLDEALELGLEPATAVRAHKLRAFIECIGGQIQPCKEHFRKALKLDPAFDLLRAEAGHPMWGPAFREVRAASPAPPAANPKR